MAKQQKDSTLIFFKSSMSPPSRFVHMTLKALGLNFTSKEVDFLNGENKSPEFLAINPRGKVPAIKDGDFCIGESRAVAMYLCNKFAPPDSTFYPKEPEARGRVDQILFIDEGVIDSMYQYSKPFQVFFLKQKPGLGDEEKVKKSLAIYEGFLENQDFLAGNNVTIADFSAINAFGVLEYCNYDNYADFPNVKKWIARMKELPYYEKTVGKPVKQTTDDYQKLLKA